MKVFTSKKYYDTVKSAVEKEHTQILRSANLTHLKDTARQSLEQFYDVQLVKDKVSNARLKVLEELDRYLMQFEKQFKSNGGRIFWADSSKEAVGRIKLLMAESEERDVMCSQGKILHEIDFFSSFNKKKDKIPVSADTAGYIDKLTGEKFSHNMWVAMDNSPEDIHEKLREKYYPEEEVISAKALSRALKKELVGTSATNTILISEADFVATDSGALCFFNDGFDLILASARVKKHIVVVGIDRLIPSLDDLESLLPLKASAAGVGCTYPVANIITSPRKKDEIDGPDELVVILVNNGRTDILNNKMIRKVLTCIHCGACQNNCPVYNIAGTAPYQITYTGPYGVVTAHNLNGDSSLNHLNYASTLCGKCSEACPVDINLHEMIIFNRREAIKRDEITPEMKRFIRGYKFITASRRRMNMGPTGIKNMVLRNYIIGHWGAGRAVPKVASKNFSQLYSDK